MTVPPVQAPPPRRTIKSWLVPLIIGLVIGGSCVTCARLPGPTGEEVVPGSDVRIGVVEVTGPIAEVSKVVRHVRTFARRDDLAALVVRIDSPGGSVAPSQEVFEAMRYASESMPVVASMGTVAASGGFWIALAGDWVVASPGSITGSIGVITQVPDLRGLAERIDFRLRTFKSGEVKDLGNPLREVTEADAAVFNQLIDDVYDQFVSTTAERRGLSRSAVEAVADGRILTGRDAKAAGLVDELGGLYTAARRAVIMSRTREGTETSTSTADVMDPTLVYPRDGASEFLELLQSSVRDGLANGVERVLGDGPSSGGVELR